MVVWRRPSDQIVGMKTDIPVGLYFGDLPSMSDTYEEFVKGIIFWNIKQTLYEYNGEAFVSHMRAANLIGRLYHIDNSPGMKVTEQVKLHQTYLGSQFFGTSRHKKITLIQILQALLLWGGDENTDVGSAWHAVLYLLDLTKSVNIVSSLPDEKSHASSIIKLGQYNGLGNPLLQGTGQLFKLGVRAR